MAAVQQHLAFDRGDGASRSGARHCSRNMLPHRAAELFPVPSVGVAASAGASGVGYRVTQGVHVGTGMATIPLVLVKLWSVYPNRFRWPPFRSVKHAVERLTVALLIPSTLVQLFTGFFNVLGWYPFRWDFLSVHYYLAYVVVGSVLLHIAVKRRYRSRAADQLPTVTYSPRFHGMRTPSRIALLARCRHRSLRDCPGAVLTAAGAGIGVVVVTSVGQALTPFEPVGLLAPQPQGDSLGGGRPDRRGGERDRCRHGIPLDAPDHRSYVVRTHVG